MLVLVFIPKITILSATFYKTEGIILKCNQIIWDRLAGTFFFLMIKVKTCAPTLAGGGDGFMIMGTPCHGGKMPIPSSYLTI